MTLEFKSFPNLLEGMVAYVIANTPLTDINAGSVLLTMLEAAASNDYEQFLSMVDIVKTYNLDTTTGADLDERALEYGLERLSASKASGYVTVSDSAVTKVSTKIYAGKPGPISGQNYIYVENATGFTPTGGSIIVGRGTNNNETVAYPTSSITDMSGYYRIDLTSSLANSHGTEETVILSQGGLRLIPAGTGVYVPATDTNVQLDFQTKEDAALLDGEESISDIPIIATGNGTQYNVPTGSIVTFSSAPFATAEVTNDYSLTNGRDVESDQELRDRIKNHIQSLSRATETTLLSQLKGVTSDEQQATVVSTYFVETTVIGEPSKLYIDDGSGLEATWSGVGDEEIIGEATGGEQYFQLDNYPLTKASLISQAAEPYDLSGGLTLTFAINDSQSTINLNSSYILDVTNASAEEVAAAITMASGNSVIEARTTDDHTRIIIQGSEPYDDKIECNGGTANSALLFVEDRPAYTLNLYKNDLLLSKDGEAAWVESGNALTNFGLIDGDDLQISVDGTTTQVVTFYPSTSPSPASWIASEINTQCAGVLAEAVVNPGGGEKVRITSNNTVFSSSSIQIVGGTANASAKLNFPLTLNRGTTSDYYLNRYNGQIKLDSVLVAGDKLTAGTERNRAWLQCATAEPYTLTSGQTLVLIVDDNLPYEPATLQTFTFRVSGSYTAQQIADLINNFIYDPTNPGDVPFNGATFFTVTDGTDTYLAVRTNTQDDTFGNIEVSNTSTNTTLDFPKGAGTTQYNQPSNYAYSETNNVPVRVMLTSGTAGGQTTVDDINDLHAGKSVNIIDDDTGSVTGYISNIYDTALSAISFSGSGSNDLTLGSSIYTGTTTKVYVVEIDAGDPTNPNTYKWSNDSGTTWIATNVNIVGGPVLLEEGVSITFSAVTGHVTGDYWTFTANSSIYTLTIDQTWPPSGVLNISAYTTAQNARIINNSASSFYISPNQSMMVVLDNDTTDRAFDVPMAVAGTITTSNTNVNFRAIGLASSYTTNYFFRGFLIRFNDNTLTAALRSKYHFIDNYVGTTGSITTTAVPMWGATIPAVGDTFTISPITAQQLVRLASDPHFTTLNVFGEIATSHQGKKIQISATAPGEAKSVQVTGGTANNFSIPFTSNGTVGGSTTVDSITGILVGIPVLVVDDNTVPVYTFVASITGATAPYTITFDDTWPVSSATDISAYSTVQNARIIPVNPLDFDSGLLVGIDAYKYYTGLVQEVQRTMDGWDEDLVTYPGYKACGPHIEVTTPTIIPISMTIDITPDTGVTLDSLKNPVKAAVSSYINSLGIGQDVILTEVTYRIQQIGGINDVEYISPTANVTVPDGGLIRITDTAISIV